MGSQALEVYDLLILVDATYSMSSYLASLQTSLPQIISISTLTDCFSRIGILAYRDYCDKRLLEWSQWFSPGSLTERPQVDLIAMAKSLEPLGGGDGPEAAKTGLARAYELMREDATTIILFYTDAPPHTKWNGNLTDSCSNFGPEQRALGVETSYGGFGPQFADLTSAAKLLSGRKGNKKAQIFSILQPSMHFHYAGYYNYLSTMTRGATFYLTSSKPADISKITVEVLLSWMGAEKTGVPESTEFPAYFSRYISIDGIKSLKSENDPSANRFFLATSQPRETNAGEKNITKCRASIETLKKHLPKKSTPLDFVKRYKTDEKYKRIAVDQLKKIIDDDVSAISLNPVFGSLWRNVCNDRDNERRDEVITAFGLQVDRIKDAGEKERMKSWLEESYDYTAEVTEAIESVPVAQRFPCVCLDPTLAFETNASDDPDELSKPITFFRRDELLEIGRSCDYKILRRLGRVLTRLTYIKSADEMPSHIALASGEETPKIPMALASPEFGRRFWKILLHIVVPGTMLAARPAALLAALSIRLGVQPLLPVAEQEMLMWPDRWNNLEIPETWNMGCLGLLLDADRAYQNRHEAEEKVSDFGDIKERPSKRPRLEVHTLLTTPKFKSPDGAKKAGSLLRPKDRQLFEKLVSYKMLELNLETSLTARIGWTPEKTSVPVGPIVTCKDCLLPRSVTIMGVKGRCGFCLWTQYASQAEKEEHTHERCKKGENEETPATWVECNLRSCRAQYVVYRPQGLNVKPKCHYCRNNEKAPVVECKECLNRVIWPLEYRTGDIKDFKCYACCSGRKTIVDVETTASKLSAENTTAWLLRNQDNKIAEPFNKRSLFHTISTAGTEKFTEKVELLPAAAQSNLVFHGKLIRNTPDLIKQLHSWVTRRRTEQGQCSICFSSFRKDALLPICGRSGCYERVCKSCLEGWYGVNAPGKIINTTTCLCPFCRRAPTAKTLSNYGMGIHAVADLNTAIRESGDWISAWCQLGGHARRYLERVCAAGAPAELRNWSCDECFAEIEAEKGKRMKKQRECPGCGVLTEKAGGCNHITCPCGVHWCFVCGQRGKSGGDIYSHLAKEHGGFFDADADYEYYDNDDGDVE